MRCVHLSDAAWMMTFPHRVGPLPDEWLPGLLLRCDEVNQWSSGTTLGHLRHMHARKSYWLRADNFIALPAEILNDLADWLGGSVKALLATTYQVELARIFDRPHVPPKRLTASWELRVCPTCLVQKRLLRRTLVLPQIRYCPQHQVVLLKRCQCGALLSLFSLLAQPFTCHACGLDWAKLPATQASPEHIAREQQYLLHYALFFSRGTLALLERALRHIGKKLREEKGDDAFWEELFKQQEKFTGRADQYQANCSLNAVVSALVRFDLSPRHILVADAPLFGYGSEWSNPYYYAVVNMLADALVPDDDGESAS
jgi:TniQ protein